MSQQPSTTSSGSSARPFLAAFASAIVPGTGQFIAGHIRRGWVLIAVDFLILSTFLFFFNDTGDVLDAAVRPSSLAMLMIGNIIVLAYRVWAADDAYRTAKVQMGSTVDGGRSTAVIVSSIVLIGILLAPHAIFSFYDLKWYGALTSVFGDNVAATETTVATTAATTGGPSPATSIDGAVTSGSVDDSTPLTSLVAGPAIWDGFERLNILLVGGDFGVGRTGIRTDTMITVSIDPETGDAAMFSVPRNWTYSPLPTGMGIWDCDCYPELINELWVMGEQHPDAFPGPGTPSENAVKGVNSAFLGIPIHYYAMVNLDGFVDVVDAIGGVDIYVPSLVIDDDYPHEDGSVERIEIQPGTQHMDGHLALAYARTRHQDSDYFRMGRQRCVIEAVLEQTSPTDLLLNFGTFVDVIERSVLTDIPLDALPELVKLLPDIDLEEIVSVRFIPPDYHLKYRDDGKAGAIANIDLVHEHVQLVIEDPDRAVEELGLDRLEDVCGEAAA